MREKGLQITDSMSGQRKVSCCLNVHSPIKYNFGLYREREFSLLHLVKSVHIVLLGAVLYIV